MRFRKWMSASSLHLWALYLSSAGRSRFEKFAMACSMFSVPICVSVPPIASWHALTQQRKGLLQSGACIIEACVRDLCRVLTALSHEEFHCCIPTFLLVRSVGGVAISEKYFIKWRKSCSSLIKQCSSEMLWRFGHSKLPRLQSAPILMPYPPTLRPGNSFSSLTHVFFPKV